MYCTSTSGSNAVIISKCWLLTPRLIYNDHQGDMGWLVHPNCRWLIVRCHLSPVICHLLSLVTCCHLSLVTCGYPVLPVTCRLGLSCVTCHMSLVLSGVTCHLSLVTGVVSRYLLLVTCVVRFHMSLVIAICHLSLVNCVCHCSGVTCHHVLLVNLSLTGLICTWKFPW